MKPQVPAVHPRLARNNFDLLRVALSMMVVLVHCADLSGSAQLAWIPLVLSSKLAVDSFFVVSGFLIFMSYERSTTLVRFAEKRARRLYPAYLVMILLCAFGLLSISSELPEDYFNWTWVKYVAANLVFLNFLQPSLPGVFDSNAIHAVNGALWSLKVEVTFYVSLPLIVMLFRFGRTKVLFIGYLLSVLWAAAMSHLAATKGTLYIELSRQLPGALSYFLAGAAIYYHLPVFERHIKPLLFMASAVLAFGQFIDLTILYPAALAIVVCFCALFCFAGNFGRYGDFSYGLYIVHFPVVQILVAKGVFNTNPWLGLLLSASIAMLLAVLMWHCVEKRFLGRSSHYVQSTTAA